MIYIMNIGGRPAQRRLPGHHGAGLPGCRIPCVVPDGGRQADNTGKGEKEQSKNYSLDANLWREADGCFVMIMRKKGE